MSDLEYRIRRSNAERLRAALAWQEWWDSLSAEERHAISCYASQFGRRCRCRTNAETTP